MVDSRPLLSICIPTYNRAALLRSSVESVLSDIDGLNVELVISNNSSTDDTDTVMQRFAGCSQLRYSKNAENIGACLNFGLLTTQLARGRFAWVLGDDDLIVHGAARRIIETIETHPQIDYIFANHTYKHITERYQQPDIQSNCITDVGFLVCFDNENYILDTWEKSLLRSDVAAAQTSIVCHIAKVELWKARPFRGTIGHEFRNFEETFPHLAILTPSLIGRPIFYHGQPLSIQYIGAQEWFNEHWSRILFTHVLEFSDRLERAGIDPCIVRHYRKLVFSRNSEFSLVVSSQKSQSAKAKFLLSFLSKYGTNVDCRKLIASLLSRKLRKVLLHR